MRANKARKVRLIHIYNCNPFIHTSMGNKITPDTIGKLSEIRNNLLWKLEDNRRQIES